MAKYLMEIEAPEGQDFSMDLSSNLKSVSFKGLFQVKEPAEFTRRYVVWHDNLGQGSLIYLVGYCPQTLAYYCGLFLEAKSVVPEVNAQNAICSKVTHSRAVYGFTVMVIPFKADKREIPGFTETSFADLDISY